MVFPILVYLAAGIAIIGMTFGMISLLFALIKGKRKPGLNFLFVGACACLPWVFLATMFYLLGYRRAGPMQMPEPAKAVTTVR
jgi:hypothetical protein